LEHDHVALTIACPHTFDERFEEGGLADSGRSFQVDNRRSSTSDFFKCRLEHGRFNFATDENARSLAAAEGTLRCRSIWGLQRRKNLIRTWTRTRIGVKESYRELQE
jgi:hypothetical protein